MDRKLLAAAVLLIALLVPVMYLATSAQSYEKFRMTGTPGEQGACEQYYEACTCYGSVAVAQSYPPQYFCDGYERCEPINRTVCE